MSHIDTIKHELVGYLNGLPIYHPIENQIGAKWGDPDFSCNQSNLVIGGGGGEHPGLVIHNLPSLVCEYLLYDIEQNSENSPDHYRPPSDEVRKLLLDIAVGKEPNLEFCGWSIEHHKQFIERAMSPVHNHPLAEESAAEKWIRLSIGEFVYFSLQPLNSQHKVIQEIVEAHFEWPVGYWMCNVTCPPPGYIKSRRESLQSSGFQDQGFFRWDYVYPPRSA